MFRKLFLLLALAPLALAQQGSAGAASGADQPSGELRLEDVVREVLAANPALGRAATLVAAQRAHVSQVGVLPDPTLTVSWMGNPVPFEVMDNDPSSYRGLTVMQMVPLGRQARTCSARWLARMWRSKRFPRARRGEIW